MNILPLVKSNINFNNSHISFSSQSVVQNDLYSIDNKLFIKNKVNEIINERRKNTVALISDYAVSDLKNNLLNKLNNTKKLDDINNKVFLLEEIANSYSKINIEKAFAIKIQTAYEILNCKNLNKPEKLNLIKTIRLPDTADKYVNSSFVKTVKYEGLPFKEYNTSLILNFEVLSYKFKDIYGYDIFNGKSDELKRNTIFFPYEVAKNTLMKMMHGNI